MQGFPGSGLTLPPPLFSKANIFLLFVRSKLLQNHYWSQAVRNTVNHIWEIQLTIFEKYFPSSSATKLTSPLLLSAEISFCSSSSGERFVASSEEVHFISQKVSYHLLEIALISSKIVHFPSKTKHLKYTRASCHIGYCILHMCTMHYYILSIKFIRPDPLSRVSNSFISIPWIR